MPVPAGTYRFTTHYQYIAGTPSVAFRLGVTKTPPPECTSSALAFSVTTNRRSYAPGQEVVMTTTATNVSGSPCSAVVGRDRGYSPSFLVTSSKGETVWDRCWVDDQPGACFDILVTYPLSRGQSFIETARWDQLSGGPSTVPRQVPPGRYDETSDYFQGSASTNFVLRAAS